MKKYKTLKEAQNDAYKNGFTQVDVSSKFDFDAMLEINKNPNSGELVYFLNTKKGRKSITGQRAYNLIQA